MTASDPPAPNRPAPAAPTSSLLTERDLEAIKKLFANGHIEAVKHLLAARDVEAMKDFIAAKDLDATGTVVTAKDLEAATPAPSWSRHPFIPGYIDRPPLTSWLRHNWFDIFVQLLCLATAYILYLFASPVMPHIFPLYANITHNPWGLKYARPYQSEYIGTIACALVSFFIPAAIMGAMGLWGTRRFGDSNAALIGLGYALATSTLITILLKLFIGGLRPHFLSVCDPLIPPSSVGVSSSGPGREWYTAAQVCRNPNVKHVKEAQMSFPSGHANAAFAGFGFLALYLNAKLKIFGRGRRSGFPGYSSSPGPQHHGRVQCWKLVAFIIPWLIAIWIAGSKVRDGWHHPVDVIFGALVGTLFALMAFRMVYRSVYDCRTNHEPMEE